MVLDMANNANITEWNSLYRRILLKNLHSTLPIDLIKETLIRLTTKN